MRRQASAWGTRGPRLLPAATVVTAEGVKQVLPLLSVLPLLLLLLLEPGVVRAVDVVQAPLIRIGERLIGVRDLPEALLRVGVLVLIWVVLFRSVAICGLDILRGGSAPHTEV